MKFGAFIKNNAISGDSAVGIATGCGMEFESR
jgi:hypothetical protein